MDKKQNGQKKHKFQHYSSLNTPRHEVEEGVGVEEVEARARLQSLTLPHAGDWLHAAPITALGLHLQPQEFVMAAAYKLGLPLYRVEGVSPTCPACHQPADVYGIHAMNCGTGGERIHRHTLLVDVVHQAGMLAPGLGQNCDFLIYV